MGAADVENNRCRCRRGGRALPGSVPRPSPLKKSEEETIFAVTSAQWRKRDNKMS
jgi:hypothetical protein